MSVYAGPGTSFEATTRHPDSGLVGTIAVRIMDGLGATTTARTTDDIIENPAGSGIYTATLQAPVPVGTYTIVWDTDDNPDRYAVEALYVGGFTLPPEPLRVRPGDTFEATTSNANTGLTGTIGVRLMDGIGGTSLPRTTTGIIETPAGSGIYTAVLTAPATVGTYQVVWDTGGGSPTWAVEDLNVTYGSDLTTLANVRAFLQKNTADTAQDGIIQQLITRASAAIETYAGREFHPTNNATRTFNYLGGSFISLSPYELRTITEATIDTGTSDETDLTATDYWFSPATSPGGTYQALSLPSDSTIYNNSSNDRRVLSITGDWGFASVPPDVEHACIVTVAIWLRRDVAAFSTTFSIDEQRLERPESLPSAARAIIDTYRALVVVG